MTPLVCALFSWIFSIFSGGGEGESEAPGRGASSLLKIPVGGGLPGEGTGAEGSGGLFQKLFGGGGKIFFFRGQNSQQVFLPH